MSESMGASSFQNILENFIFYFQEGYKAFIHGKCFRRFKIGRLYIGLFKKRLIGF